MPKIEEGYRDMLSNIDRTDTTAHRLAPPHFDWLRRLIIALTILAWMAIGALLLAVAQRMVGTLILFIAAGLLAYLIHPLVLLLQRFMPRLLAIMLVYLIVLGVVSFLIYNVVSTIVRQLSSVVLYFQYVLSPQGQRQLQPFIETLQRLGISQDQLMTFGEQFTNQMQGFITQIVPVLSGITNLLISIIVIAVLSIYLLLDGGRIVHWLRYKTPLDRRGDINFLITTAHQTIGGYFRGLLLLATTAGVSTGLVLALLGVPYAALLGAVVFVSLFIPVVGGAISGLLCVVMSLPQGWVVTLIVVIFVILLQQVLIGQILAPRVLGDAVKIHPIVAILALFAGTELLGMGVLGGSSLYLWQASSRLSLLHSGADGSKPTPNNFHPKEQEVKMPVSTLWLSLSQEEQDRARS